MESHGSKSFLILTRDEYYNGSLYEVTGPRVRRGGGGEKDGAAAASGELCVGSPLLRVVGPGTRLTSKNLILQVAQSYKT